MNFHRFDVVVVDLGNSGVGSEQNGLRPSVVIQNNDGNAFSATTIIIPLTSRMKHMSQPTHTIIKAGESGLRTDSMLLGEAIRQISDQRVVRVIGHINDEATQNEIKRVYLANFGE